MLREQDKETAQQEARQTTTADPEVKPDAPRRRFTTQEKLRILEELDSCTEPGQVGSLLRREGIYSSYVTRWRREREAGLLKPNARRKKGRRPNSEEQRAQEMAQLRAENQRLQLRLQKAEAIIEVQKKVSFLLGLEELTS